MPLFSIKNDRLERIKEFPFKSERKDIQKVTESSLKEVFGYDFINSEVTLGNLRIDTLAFDAENKSFVIIEYKIDRVAANLLNPRFQAITSLVKTIDASKSLETRADNLFSSQVSNRNLRKSAQFKQSALEGLDVLKLEGWVSNKEIQSIKSQFL